MINYIIAMFSSTKKLKNDEYMEQELRRLSKKIKEEKLAAANINAVRRASKAHLF